MTTSAAPLPPSDGTEDHTGNSSDTNSSSTTGEGRGVTTIDSSDGGATTGAVADDGSRSNNDNATTTAVMSGPSTDAYDPSSSSYPSSPPRSPTRGMLSRSEPAFRDIGRLGIDGNSGHVGGGGMTTTSGSNSGDTSSNVGTTDDDDDDDDVYENDDDDDHDDFLEDDRSMVSSNSVNSKGGGGGRGGKLGGLLNKKNRQKGNNNNDNKLRKKKKPHLRNPFSKQSRQQHRDQREKERQMRANHDENFEVLLQDESDVEEDESSSHHHHHLLSRHHEGEDDNNDDDDDDFDESFDLGSMTSSSPRRRSNNNSKKKISFDARKMVENVSSQVNKTMSSISSSASGGGGGGTNANTTTTKLSVSQIEMLAQKRGANTEVERFAVYPSYAYPKTKFNREELRQEMNRPSSYYHDLRPAPLLAANPVQPKPLVGFINVEVLQCFGIPKAGVRTETSAFCVMVCQDKAFKTDTMPHVANPMWLSKMRRACIFPLYEAYARMYLGVFGRVDSNSNRDVFVGRVVIDVSRLRPGSTYDVTLPLRQSNQVYARQKCGSVRFRMHLTWVDERAALLSYLPKNPTSPQLEPHDTITIKCLDNKSFQNVVRTVHGHDMPGKFSMKLTKATMREFNFVRINLMRYLRKREIRDITQWRYPFISFFIFASWMHSVYVGSMKYVPGNIVTYLVLVLFKNYARYVLDEKYDNGFSMPTWEELMSSLLYGRPGSNHIEPLEMERMDPATCKTAASFLEDEDMTNNSSNHNNNSSSALSTSDHGSSVTSKPQRPPTLQEIANEFRQGVKRSGRRRGGGGVNGAAVNTFTGTDGVDFLVFRGFSQDRAAAVDLGRRLQHELHLFEHIRRRHEFKDENIFYSFLNYDTSEYVFKTHRPWFKNISRLMGLHRDGVSRSEAHMEFPFASGADHPRFTIKESLVIRSRESRNALARMESTDDDDEVDDDEGTKTLSESDHAKDEREDSVASITFDGSLYPDHSMFDSALFTAGKADDDSDPDDDAVEIKMEDDFEIKTLPKPPNQDMLFVKKADKPIPEALANTKHEVHRVFGHLFHDKAYKLPVGEDKEVSTQNSAADEASSVSGSPRSRNRKFPGFSSKKNNGGTRKKDTSVVKVRKDEYDKLLHSGKYSTNNVITSKVAIIVQPIVELVQLFLKIMRAQYNLLTWRDPFLTFWVLSFLIVLIPILHMFPWRLVLGFVGLFTVGPQNWLFRILREQKNGGPEPDDFDTIKKRKKIDPPKNEDEEQFYFSSFAPDNRPIQDHELDKRPDQIKEVAIPHSQLMYRRCYDWPPEPEYARVWKCDPPRSDPDAQRVLERNQCEVHDGGVGDCSSHGPSRRRNYSNQASSSGSGHGNNNSGHQNHGKLNQRARQMMTGVKSKLRRNKDKDT